MVRRGVLILGALYGLPVTAWVVGTMIRVAYYGRGLPLLNLVFPRRVPHPCRPTGAASSTLLDRGPGRPAEPGRPDPSSG